MSRKNLRSEEVLIQRSFYIYTYIHPTYKSWTSDLQKLNIRPTTVEHPTYRCGTSGIHKLNIQPTQFEDWTYKSWTPDLQQLNIPPTKVEHPTYKAMFNWHTNIIIRKSVLKLSWTSDLQYLNTRPTHLHPNIGPTTLCSTNQKILYYQNIRPTKVDHPTYILIY